ncbi:MAG: type IX secretion system membrane protein PorP/SprF [Bacteroidales bacterium]|nr:MAG: type IX secretion system membrane protein PorP/SprF [Bacteroidales bacterium]
MNKPRRLYILAVILFISLVTGHSQQLPLFSQYMMNGFLINPALAGNDGYTAINLTAREQWLGLGQAPKTHGISFQTRVLKTSYISKSTSVRKKVTRPSRSGRIGLGGYLFNDRNGIIDRTGFQLTYAYHIPLRTTNNAQLSFGLTANFFQFKINEDEIRPYDIDDPLLLEYDRVFYIPDANFGAYFTTRDYYVGFSVTELFKATFKLGKEGIGDYRAMRHYYLTGGYMFDVGVDFALQPTFLIKTSDYLKSFQVDISLKAFYREDYWLGLSYRTSDAMIIMVGVKVDQYFFGYAFDYSLTNIRKHSFGSHEIMVAVKFGSNARRYRWLNRY